MKIELINGAINPIALQWGPFRVHWYGIIIASAVILALWLSIREGRRLGIPEDDFYDALLWSLPIAVICARTYYVVFQWSYYSHNLSEIIAIWDGGIAIYGALIGGLITILCFCHYRHLNAWLFLDVLAPSVILAQAIGRWGNFMNQEVYGLVTTKAHLMALHLPTWIINQMYIGGAYRVPTYLYESVGDLLGFVILLIIRHRHHWLKQGEVLCGYLGWYALVRMIVEGMRTDSLMLGQLRVSQWLSVVILIAVVIIVIYRRRHFDLPWYSDLLIKEKKL